jgi:septal ring factor EnvC (AmiA/AmiB activator)
MDANVQAALDAVESSRPETEIALLVARVKAEALDEALRAAKDRAQAFEAALQPINKSINQLEKNLSEGDKSLVRDFTAARLRFAAARYDAEARLNQAIGNLYELQVRKSNADAERHHKRSQRFFYGMLTTQAAVIISTFSLAAQKRSLLWTLAAAAGAAAISFAIYVYLFV